MLSIEGVPETRAKNVANGIDVLATRQRKEIAIYQHAIADHQSALRECVEVLQKVEDEADGDWKLISDTIERAKELLTD